MRKIGTEKQIEKKRKSSALISIFFLAILVLGTIGYAFVSGPGKSNKQEPQVITPTGKFAINFEGQTFYLTNPTEDTVDVEVLATNTLNNYVNAPIYISSNNDAVNSELAAVLAKYASRMQKACYGKCEEDLPEKNCTENLIVWKDSTENKVYQEQNCVFIEGDLKAVDAFLYHLLGIPR
jgi:flagellar basal body-associated protein FliL